MLRQRRPHHPEHCLVEDFPAGLVIEGQGHETVFRSPVWDPPYLPTPILEIHRREFPVTLRNLVLDGRKHEQDIPEHSPAGTTIGLRVWNPGRRGDRRRRHRQRRRRMR